MQTNNSSSLPLDWTIQSDTDLSPMLNRAMMRMFREEATTELIIDPRRKRETEWEPYGKVHVPKDFARIEMEALTVDLENQTEHPQAANYINFVATIDWAHDEDTKAQDNPALLDNNRKQREIAHTTEKILQWLSNNPQAISKLLRSLTMEQILTHPNGFIRILASIFVEKQEQEMTKE